MRIGPDGGNILAIDSPIVGATGKEIVGDALETAHFGQHSLDDFQSTLTNISQNYFPYQLQPALQAFIKAHFNGYTTSIIQDRQAIGDALQTKVATPAEITEIKNTDLFKL
jgi:hypothetical protein